MQSAIQPSVSARAAKLVDAIVADADALRISVSRGEHGERLIDMGGKSIGGLEAGRRLGEVCMGGLGTVAFTQSSGLANWPLGVVVTSNDPVIACLASQYAGWTITDEASGFFALGSGPARSLSRVEDLFKELGYVDHYPQATLVIEGDKAKVTREVDGGLQTVELNMPAIVTTDLRLNQPRYASLPNIMKAKKKPLEEKTPADFGADVKPRLKILRTEEPGGRKAGVKLKSVAELVDKLKNEAGVL